MKSFPMQPIIRDEAGAVRFKANNIIETLWHEGRIDLHQIAIDAMHGRYTAADQMQLAQLIGYSVSGFGDLSYADKGVVRRADKKAEKVK